MSGRRESLERLCGQYGIATAYHDIWGKRHEVAEASLRALHGKVAPPPQFEMADRDRHERANGHRRQRFVSPVTEVMLAIRRPRGHRNPRDADDVGEPIEQ